MMTLISTVTLASAAASIDVTSIPSTYTDLLIVVSARSAYSGADAQDDLNMRINGDTGANYSGRALQTFNGSVSSGTSVTTSLSKSYFPTNSATASTFGNVAYYIPNYSGSTAKSISVDGVGENNGTYAAISIVAGLWNSTAAVNAIKIYSGNGNNVMAGSTVSVYGITKGSGGATVSP